MIRESVRSINYAGKNLQGTCIEQVRIKRDTHPSMKPGPDIPVENLSPDGCPIGCSGCMGAAKRKVTSDRTSRKKR